MMSEFIDRSICIAAAEDYHLGKEELELNTRTTFVFQNIHPFECCSCFLNAYRFYNESG